MKTTGEKYKVMGSYFNDDKPDVSENKFRMPSTSFFSRLFTAFHMDGI